MDGARGEKNVRKWSDGPEWVMPDQPEERDALGQIADEAKEAFASHDDLDRRAEELAERSRLARAKYQATQVKAKEEGMVGGSSGKHIGAGLSIAYGFLGAPIVFYLLGRWIDSQNPAGQQVWGPILGLVGFGGGLIYVFVVLKRHGG